MSTRKRNNRRRTTSSERGLAERQPTNASSSPMKSSPPTEGDIPPPGQNSSAQLNLRRDAQVVISLVGVIMAFVIAGWTYNTYFRDDSNNSSSGSAEIEGIRTYHYIGGDHSAEPVVYQEIPPVGGTHASAWQNCGFYAGAIPSERGVHSLEHGAVWITYDPALPADQVTELQSIAQSNSYVLVTAHLGLPTPVVATAWNRQLYVDSVSDPRLATFVRTFQQSTESPEPGAPCTGASSDLAA